MKGVYVLLFLIALISCQHPETHEGKNADRFQRRKKIQQEITECILKGEISTELKTKLQENKEEDLRYTLHLFLNKLDTKDREVIRKCRREIFGKMKEEFKNRKFDSFMNRTRYRHHPLLHERFGNHTIPRPEGSHHIPPHGSHHAPEGSHKAPEGSHKAPEASPKASAA